MDTKTKDYKEILLRLRAHAFAVDSLLETANEQYLSGYISDSKYLALLSTYVYQYTCRIKYWTDDLGLKNPDEPKKDVLCW